MELRMLYIFALILFPKLNFQNQFYLLIPLKLEVSFTLQIMKRVMKWKRTGHHQDS